jgi:excisionase family DNA binding protein
MKPAKKNQQSEVPPLLSVQEVADILGVCRQTVYNWMYREGLPSILVGRVRRVHPQSLSRWLAEREQKGA